MSDAQVSTANGYREFLRARMKMGRESQRGMLAELARAARVHPTMITHVFKGEAELSPEQAIRVAAHLGLDEEETDRLLNMVLLERAGTEEARRYFRRILERRDTKAPDRCELFRDWLPEAIFFLLEDARGSSTIELTRAAGECEEEVETALLLLEKHGFSRREAGLWFRVGQLQPKTECEREISREAWRRRARRGRSGISLFGSLWCTEEDAAHLRALVEEWRKGCEARKEGLPYALALDLSQFRI